MAKLTDILNEDLRKWFGKGKSGTTSGGGWDRYGSEGQKLGKCGDGKDGDAYAACLSKEKAAKLGPDGRASFVKRKRAAQKDAGDAKKGGEQSKGQKPTLVKTKANEMKINLVEKQLKGLEDIPSNVSLDTISKVDKLKIIKAPGNIIDFFVPDWASASRNFWQVIGTGKIKKNMSGEFGLEGRGLIKSSPTFKTMDALIAGVDWKSMEQTRRFNENTTANNFKLKEGISTKLKDLLNLREENEPTNPALWDKAIAAAKAKYDVYPSAYANAFASKWYKEKGGDWKTKKD